MFAVRAIGCPPNSVADILTHEAFAELTNVSRETLKRFQAYAELLTKWQGAINLVAPNSLNDLWRRHMLDSAQLYAYVPTGCRNLVDLGSGAGFPGLVLAIMGVVEVHLIESDARKAVFLAEAARAAGLHPGANPVIHRCRVEEMSGWMADVVTARACAPLGRLLDLAEPFIGPDTVCLFPKGERVADELTLAGKQWRMEVESLPSISDPSGKILRLGKFRRG
jgi:16S rRNA (guanine527-N7)-methyltransferase